MSNPIQGVNRWLAGLSIGLALMLSISLKVNVALASRIREANHRAGLRDRLQPGTALPELAATDLSGKAVHLAMKGQPSLIYVFTPACGWCTKNLENWKSLSEQVRGGHQVIGISLASNGLQEYVDRNHIEVPVYRNLSPHVVESYKLAATPTTILVGADGRVVKSWAGAYTETVQKEIEQYFHVRLPGLT